jgi:thioredoxin 1
MSVTHINSQNYEQEVENSETPVIIDFWAEWCGPCQMLGPVFEELSSDYDGKLKFVKANTEENTELAGKFSVQGIPCLIVVKKGEEVDRIVGFAPAPVLKQKIDSILEQIQ